MLSVRFFESNVKNMDDGNLDFIDCTTYMVVVTTYLVRYILSTYFFYDVTIC